MPMHESGRASDLEAYAIASDTDPISAVPDIAADASPRVITATRTTIDTPALRQAVRGDRIAKQAWDSHARMTNCTFRRARARS
jgi:hypothetical protein